MLKSLLTASTLLALLTLPSLAAFAQTEDDQPSKYTNFASDADKGTVILRVNSQDNTMEILSVNQIPKSDDEAKDLAQNGNFTPVSKDKISDTIAPETDKTSGLSSWHITYNYGYARGRYPYYPTYNYNYGYYNPCYSWSYPGYNYYAYNYWGWNTSWTPTYYSAYYPTYYSYGVYGRPYYHPYYGYYGGYRRR